MQPACIRHTDLPGASRLFLDFAYHFDRVRSFYSHDPHDPASFKRAAAEIQYPAERRAALVSALRSQNGSSASLEKLADPGTFVVATGQQVGLFSGPAYTIYKAVTAAHVARQLTDSGIPAVPVFWLATEDHDFAEVNHAWVYSARGEQAVLRVDATNDNSKRPGPVGAIPIAQPPIAELRRALEDLPFADEVVAAVEEAYPSGITMGAGFRGLLKIILAKLDLIYLDPLDPAIRKISAPFMLQAWNASSELKARLKERNRELEEAGYHAQVLVDDKTSLFFQLQNGERVQIRAKNGDAPSFADRPESLSPNALLRPVMQDYLLPTVAFIGGPGELAYLAQSQVLYDRLLGRMPVAMARNGFSLIDSRTAKLLERYHMTVAQTFCPEDALKERIAQTLVPPALEKSLEKTASEITQKLDRVNSQLEAFDPTLASALGNSRAKILHQLEKIRRKTAREALRRDQRATEEAHYFSTMLFPHRHPQERFYSILPFLAQHGMDLIDRLTEAADPHCPDHRVFLV